MTSSARSNHAAAFAAVMNRTTPVQAPARRLTATETVEEFIEACESALDAGAAGDVLPGVDVEQPTPMLVAYLLFLATEGLMANMDAIAPEAVEAWHERVTDALWQRLGFRRPPALMTVQLAFSLLGHHEHQAPELRALIWAVGDFAASGLLSGLRL